MQKSFQHAFLDDRHVAALRAFVVDVNRNRSTAVGTAQSIIAERDLLGRDLFSQPVAGDRAREHEIAFAGVTDGFMRENAGELGVEHHVMRSGLALAAFRLQTQLLIEPVEPRNEALQIEGLVLNFAKAADGVVKLDEPVIRLDGHLHHEHRARDIGVGAGAVARHQRLLARIGVER